MTAEHRSEPAHSDRSAASAGSPPPTAPPSSRSGPCVAVGLGFLAPRVETALSGAGWEATGSESVAVRKQVDAAFGGAGAYGLQVAVHSERLTVDDPASSARSPASNASSPPTRRSARWCRPQPGVSISRDGHTAVVRATAAKDPNGMVAAADDLKAELAGRRRARRRSQPHRRRRHVVRLQRSQQRGDAEVRALLLAGDAGDPRPRLRLAGRRRPAADADDRRPRPLRRRPLPRHPALADLDLGDELRADVRARARHRLRAVRRDALPRRALRPGPRAGRGGRRRRWTPPARRSSSPA